MQILVIKILSREMHLPSSDQEWQIPAIWPDPRPPLFFLFEFDDEQETSYLAASVSIWIFSTNSIESPLLLYKIPGEK